MSAAYLVSVPVTADSPADAARVVAEAMGMDELSVNDIGGLQVSEVQP